MTPDQVVLFFIFVAAFSLSAAILLFVLYHHSKHDVIKYRDRAEMLAAEVLILRDNINVMKRANEQLYEKGKIDVIKSISKKFETLMIAAEIRNQKIYF